MKALMPIFCAAIALTACSQESSLEESAEKLGITLPAESAMSVPDITAAWMRGCDEAFREKISVTSKDTETYIKKDGKLIPASSLSTSISIPWLTIYDKNKEPVHHVSGYRTNALKNWKSVSDGVTYPGPWPNLEIVAIYSDLDVSQMPDADFTFVKYSADWCAPCKAQSADLKIFKDQNPELKITHVEIIADTRNLKGNCPVAL